MHIQESLDLWVVESCEIELGLKSRVKIEECMDSARPHVRALDLHVRGRYPIIKGNIQHHNILVRLRGDKRADY